MTYTQPCFQKEGSALNYMHPHTMTLIIGTPWNGPLISWLFQNMYRGSLRMLVSVCLGAFWGLLLAGRLLSPYGMQDILHLWQVQFGRFGSRAWALRLVSRHINWHMAATKNILLGWKRSCTTYRINANALRTVHPKRHPYMHSNIHGRLIHIHIQGANAKAHNLRNMPGSMCGTLRGII